MSKFKYLVILFLIMLFIVPKSVFGVGNITISTSNINIVKGSSANFTITATNAAGRVDITSSNSSVATISQSSVFLDMQSSTISVVGHSVGTATIKVHVVDGTTYDDEDLTGRVYNINVTVVEPNNNPIPNNANTNNNLSRNNKLKELSVEGYELVKVDDNNYTLTVSNDIASIKINAVQEDTKAKISGIGDHQLEIGENIIEVIVTSESGAKNKYIINVTRNDGFYLEDLDKLLNDENINDINVNINVDSVISSDIIEKIKNSKKLVKLNYFDENKKMIYSWSIDGNNIEKTNEFSSSISYISEYVKEIAMISNYAEGLHVNFKHSGDLPNGTKIKLFVGDKFEDGNSVNVYRYSENTLNLIKSNLIVTGGYIEFDIEHCSEYFVTQANLNNVLKEERSSNNLVMLFSIIELVIIICLLIFIISKNKKIKKENEIEKPKLIDNNNIDYDKKDIF